MYTQCPECSVVLSISATDLRAAGGEVCCGACNSVFNALHHLIDTDEEPTPSMMLEPDSLADDLESEDELSEDEPKDSHAETPLADEAIDDEEADDEDTVNDPEEPASELDEEGLAWSRTIAGLGLADQSTLETLARYDQMETTTAAVVEQTEEVQTPEEEPAEEPPSVMFEIVSEVADHSTPETYYDPDELLGSESPRTVPWIRRILVTAIVIATVALITQIIHFQRNELATSPKWGPLLQAVYKKLDLPMEPNWDVKQYIIAQGGGSADPRLPGILLVRATLSNVSDLGMPYPLIKLSLKDRWGDAVGGRTFSPPEYLETTPEADALLAPGVTVAVQIRVVDPGEKNANNFALDACLNNTNGGMTCAYDLP